MITWHTSWWARRTLLYPHPRTLMERRHNDRILLARMAEHRRDE